MNYIKRLEKELKDAQQESSTLHSGINALMAYLQSPKFHGDTTVQVNDVMHRLMEIKMEA